MDSRSEVKEFLASRRARVTPEQAAVPVYGRNRRVKGLRREEVALLAGVGDLDLSFEAMELPGEDLTMLVYTAEPSSPSQEALDLLASWAATLDRERQDLQDIHAPAPAEPAER